MDESYFHKFDLERICIDKVFFIVYDEEYAAGDHIFDKDLRDKFIQHVKRSRIHKGNFEQVLRRENNYSSWELQLKGPRVMRFHVNVIHFLQEQHNIKPDGVLHDDNFMPIHTNLKVIDYVTALRNFISDAMELYRETVHTYWGVDLGKVRYKISEIEIPYEVYPCSVEDIADNLYARGVAFRKYNSQSGTLYLNDVKTDNMMSVSRKYDKIQKIDNHDIEVVSPDIVYLNKINSGRNSHKIQIKIYQKTFGLVRIEFTIFSLDTKNIFNFSSTDQEISETLVMFIHHGLKENGITPDRYDRSLDDVIRFRFQGLRRDGGYYLYPSQCRRFRDFQGEQGNPSKAGA